MQLSRGLLTDASLVQTELGTMEPDLGVRSCGLECDRCSSLLPMLAMNLNGFAHELSTKRIKKEQVPSAYLQELL